MPIITILCWPVAGMFIALGYIVYEVVYLIPRGKDKVSCAQRALDEKWKGML